MYCMQRPDGQPEERNQRAASEAEAAALALKEYSNVSGLTEAQCVPLSHLLPDCHICLQSKALSATNWACMVPIVLHSRLPEI